jgi:hypothetical protein
MRISLHGLAIHNNFDIPIVALARFRYRHDPAAGLWYPDFGLADHMFKLGVLCEELEALLTIECAE